MPSPPSYAGVPESTVFHLPPDSHSASLSQCQSAFTPRDRILGKQLRQDVGEVSPRADEALAIDSLAIGAALDEINNFILGYIEESAC